MRLWALETHKELVIQGTLQNLVDWFDLVLLIRRENDNILQINKNKLVKHITKHIVSQRLKHY